MAAIIAQMTRANRERIEKKKMEIVISKCMYDISPFPERFIPEKHNKYLMAKKLVSESEKTLEFHQLVIKRMQDIESKRARTASLQLESVLVEVLIILISLSLVPAIMLFIHFYWPVQVDLTFSSS